MTKNKIISDLFVSKDFNSCIGKMKPEHLQDDLKAEVALILCELPEEKVIQLHNNGGLKFYTVRIILNQIQSNSSPFFKKFRQQNLDISEVNETDIEQGVDYNPKKDAAIVAIDGLPWYDREIVKMYAIHGTYRAIEKETGIPFESIYKTVQKACKAIRKKVA
jgi:hypothetical protein